MATFLGIGDTHLGPGPRNGDRLRALDQIVDEGLSLPRLDGWLWPGDLNHGRMTIDDRNALVVRLLRMAARAPVVICYGNHDLPGDLDVFARLQTTHPIHVVAAPAFVRLGETVLFVLPYPSRGSLLAGGASSDDVYAEGRAALGALLMDAGRELAAARAQGLRTLMIGHANVAGAVASTGQPQIGREIELDAAMLSHLGPCAKVLGHIHKAQEVGGAHYLGSICRLDWGEIEPKSYSVIEVAADSAATIQRCPVAVAPLYHVEGTLTREGFAGQMVAGPAGAAVEAPDSWAGCEVRVRYRFAASDREVLDPQVVAAGFRDALRVTLDPVAVPDRALRAPAVAAARTLAEKLDAWAAANGECLPPATREALAALDQWEGAAVLTALVARLQALDPTASTAEVAA